MNERAGRICDAFLLLFALALPLSIAVTEIALLAAIACWLLTHPWRRGQAPAGRAVGAATLALALAWILASLFASDQWASFVKARKLYSITLVPLLIDRARDPRLAGRIAACALVGASASAGFGIVDFVLRRIEGLVPGWRLEGVFSTAMTTGNVFALLALAALGEAMLRRGRARAAALVACATTALALVGTLTRSSWLGILTGGAIFGARRPRFLFAVGLALAVGIALGPAEIRDRVGSIADPTNETNAGRISLWRSGMEVVRDHPWLGVGLADHYALIESRRRPDATFHAGHFHNNVVQVAASTGILGLLAYSAWMGLVGWLLLRGARGGAGDGATRALTGFAVWLGFQVVGMFDWSFGDAEVANQLFLWVGLGLAAAAPRPGNPLADRDLPPG